MREAPEAGTRLHALEVWALQPGDAIDAVTYGLVDGDESVRARAQELYAQTLAREADAASVSPGDRPMTEPAEASR